MYGTVTRFKVKPGMRSLFLGWTTYSSWTMRTVPGIVDSILFQIDGKPNEFMAAVIFETQDVYRANAESDEQHEEYLHLLEFLAAPPEWHDGEVAWTG